MLNKLYQANAKVKKYQNNKIKRAEALAEQLVEILKLRGCKDEKGQNAYYKYFAK